MKFKEFFKPTKKKVLLFVILWSLIPFPTYLKFEASSPIGDGWYLIPIINPFLFFQTILQIFSPKIYSVTGWKEILLVMLVYPVVSYLVSCLTVLIYEKIKNKK